MAKQNNIASRKRAIKELIDSKPIENQQTLVELLKKRYDIDSNQAVISRDLREMGVTKRSMGDKQIYESDTTDASREILRHGVLDIVHNQNLVVVKTLAGMAALVADYIDSKGDLEVMGTLSGENVVFVAPEDIKKISSVYKKLCTVLHVKK